MNPKEVKVNQSICDIKSVTSFKINDKLSF